MKLSTTNIDQLLPNSESRLIRLQLKVEDEIKFHVRKTPVSFMFSNDIGDEKHYIFHCTNPRLKEIRKTFIPEIYETFTPYPDVNPINDILNIILRGSSNMNYNKIGKFQSLVLVNTQDLLTEVERGTGSTS